MTPETATWLAMANTMEIANYQRANSMLDVPKRRKIRIGNDRPDFDRRVVTKRKKAVKKQQRRR